MSLLSTLGRFRSRFHEAAEAACVGEQDVDAQRIASAAEFPHMQSWHPVHYPGEVSLPIFLLPLVAPLSPKLGAAVLALHEAMGKDGVSEPQRWIRSRHEQGQAHLWLANLERRRYLLIGQITFIREECSMAAPEPAEAPAEPGVLRLRRSVSVAPPLVSRWWLHHVWLSPAYRGQRTFTHSMDYLNDWHPGFQVRDPGALLAGALKDHPEHIFEPFPEKV